MIAGVNDNDKLLKILWSAENPEIFLIIAGIIIEQCRALLISIYHFGITIFYNPYGFLCNIPQTSIMMVIVCMSSWIVFNWVKNIRKILRGINSTGLVHTCFEDEYTLQGIGVSIAMVALILREDNSHSTDTMTFDG